ncbi:unnamed protein product [Leuciscus chuanchicus]
MSSDSAGPLGGPPNLGLAPPHQHESGGASAGATDYRLADTPGGTCPRSLEKSQRERKYQSFLMANLPTLWSSESSRVHCRQSKDGTAKGFRQKFSWRRTAHLARLQISLIYHLSTYSTLERWDGLTGPQHLSSACLWVLRQPIVSPRKASWSAVNLPRNEKLSYADAAAASLAKSLTWAAAVCFLAGVCSSRLLIPSEGLALLGSTHSLPPFPVPFNRFQEAFYAEVVFERTKAV